MERSLLYLMLLCAILPIFINAENDKEGEEYSEDYYDDHISAKLDDYVNKRANGTFEYKYIISDRTSHEVKGTIKDVNGTKVIIAKGEYQWELEKGLTFFVEYEADEKGFRIIKTGTFIDDRVINPKTVSSLLG